MVPTCTLTARFRTHLRESAQISHSSPSGAKLAQIIKNEGFEESEDRKEFSISYVITLGFYLLPN